MGKAYQSEPSHLREVVWARGYVEPWELLKIAAWKSAQSTALISLNEPEDIVRVTRAALDAVHIYAEASNRELRKSESEWHCVVEATKRAVSTDDGLRKLTGIRMAMASAVLAILNPDLWPVIDRWAMTGVYGQPVRQIKNTFAEYVDYWGRLADLQLNGAQKGSIHDIDQSFYMEGIARSKRAPASRVSRTR